MTVLITGASGFVGSALCRRLAGEHSVLAVSRVQKANQALYKSEQTSQSIRGLEADFTKISSIQAHLAGLGAVIHCAARVHQVRETANDPLSEYRRVNRDATLFLAQAAAQEGVKRFIFLSSVKVNGEFSRPGQPFQSSEAAPLDPYGVSKWEAEQGLREIAAKTGMEVVIIRPPLVYGPGVKANFLTMMRWLHRGLPLPLGAIHNRRSLVGLANLVDFIALCLTHPLATNQTLMISDQQDVSTTQLLQGLGHALGRPARLVPIPSTWLRWGLHAVGQSAIAQRLCADLAVDSTAATALLGWKPPASVEQGLRVTAEHFLAQIAAESKKPS
jgi:UDP-4-keto-D-QuiNAc 4-reductase